MSKILKYFIIPLFLFLFLIPAACESPHIQSDKSELIESIIEKNLEAATNKDIDSYLSTISSSAHNDTRVALEEFFGTYSVTHQLLDFEIIEEEDERVVAKTRQKTTEENGDSGDEYKDHLSEVLIILVKEGNEWKINESSITAIEFLE